MSKATKREKVLIIILVCLVLTYGAIQFVIIPMYSTYSNTLMDREFYQKEKDRIDDLLISETFINASYEEAQKQLAELKLFYPMEMPNEKIDNILTGLCLENKLDPVSLYLSSAADIEVVSEEDDSELTSRFSTVAARMVVSGEDSALRGILNAVEKIEYIRITQVTFAHDTRNMEIQRRNITLNFEIIMLKELPELAEG